VGIGTACPEALRLLLEREEGAPVEREEVSCLVRLEAAPVAGRDCAEMARAPMTTLANSGIYTHSMRYVTTLVVEVSVVVGNLK
jgi:hypothetical protein